MILFYFLTLLLVFQVVKADNVTVHLTDPSVVCSWTQPGNTCWGSALPDTHNNTIPWQWAQWYCKDTHVVGLNTSVQTMSLQFTGIQAWITLYPDSYGSNAQISVDEKIVANVSTVNGGGAWFEQCKPIMGWTGILPYGQHNVSLLKNIQTGNTWVYVGDFVYDNSTAPPSATSTSANGASTSPASGMPSKSSLGGGAIAGIAVGGIVLLLALLGFYFWRRRRYSRLRSEIDLDDGSPTSVSDHDVQPQPYITSFDPSPPSHEGIPVMPVPTAGDRKAPSGPSAPTVSTSTPQMVEAVSLPPDMLQALAERNAELTATIRLMRENPDAVPPSLFQPNAEAPPSYNPQRGGQQP